MTIEWTVKSLAELCQIKTGKKDVNQGNPQGEFPFFTCAAKHTYSDTFSFDTEALLIAGNGAVGTVQYFSGRFEAYQRTYVLSQFNSVNPTYLFYYLDGYLREVVEKQRLGNTMPYIKIGMLNTFNVPVPPLAEQQRIVAILDEAFDVIATAKANTEKNLQNAGELLSAQFHKQLTTHIEKWPIRKLHEVCLTVSTGPFGSMVHKSDYTTKGVPLVNPINIVNALLSG